MTNTDKKKLYADLPCSAFVPSHLHTLLTRKNVIVEPLSNVPYEISVWPARSSAFSIGVTIRSTVRNAAKFAVYDDIIINVKNHLEWNDNYNFHLSILNLCLQN